MPKQTLEQERAQDAWNKAAGCEDSYVKLAKGLPALIMNSGLMQVMAYLHEKGPKNPHYAELAEHLRSWLSRRFSGVRDDFAGFMNDMMEAEPRKYQDITTEAFAWLRWMRQMAPARKKGS